MKNNYYCLDTVVEDCRKALKSCPHSEGTVSVMCRVCLNRHELLAWDEDHPAFMAVDCPRCSAVSLADGLEVCPCLEHFSEEVIEEMVENDLRCDENADAASRETDPDEDEVKPILVLEALRWTQPRDRSTVVLYDADAAPALVELRRWAEGYMRIRIPEPKAALILHLLDRKMIEVEIVPKTGRLVFRARGAKAEFGRFLRTLDRTYADDQMTVRELLSFAYGVSAWKTGPGLLQECRRGNEIIVIHTSRYRVIPKDGVLRGKPEDIEAVILEAFGCGSRRHSRKPNFA